MDKFKKILKGLKSFVGRGVQSYEDKLRAMDTARRERNIKLIESQGHTPESYMQMQAMNKALKK